MTAATDPDSRRGMARVGASRPAPRLLFPTDRADLRVTWHQDDDLFVLSLWHADACVGTAPLGARDAAEVASFLVTQLGERAHRLPHVVGPETRPTPAGTRSLVQRLLDRARRHF